MSSASERDDELLSEVSSLARPAVRVRDGCVFVADLSDELLDGVQNLEMRESDTIVVTWPKSGTTWMRYIIHQIIKQREDIDYSLMRHLYLEHPLSHGVHDIDGDFKLVRQAPSPRKMKSHLQARFLPIQLVQGNKGRVIYIARNPKDVAVSHYHFCKVSLLLPSYQSWEEFLDQFCKGLLPYGDWFEHVLYWWRRRREQPNVLFVKYEDMKRDLAAVIKVVAEFHNISLSANEIEGISRKSTFQAMKGSTANPDKFKAHDYKKPGETHSEFMRKGEIGDWKNHFTAAQNERFDKLYKEKMSGTGLDFVFE